MPSSDLVATIVAEGQRYTAWKSVMVRRDYMNPVACFEFTAAEPGPYGEGWDQVRLKPGDPVQIYLGADLVISGNVTTRTASFDAKSHDLIVAGKSFTHLLDASVQIKPGNYNGYTFEQAARGVMAPTNVGLVIKNPPSIASKPFKSLCVQVGESCFEFIERIAKMRGFFLTDDESGKLVASQLDPNDAPVAELVERVNILRATGTLDDQSLWSDLTVIGQNIGDDSNWPPRDYSATVKNPNAPNRSQVIVAEHPGDAQDMQQRANLESAMSTWPSVTCSVTVVGWHKSDGSIWDVTKNVTLKSPSIFPNEKGWLTLGIQSVTFAQDSQNGTTTTLDLKLPWALTTLQNPAPGSGGSNQVDSPNPNQAQIDQPDTA